MYNDQNDGVDKCYNFPSAWYAGGDDDQRNNDASRFLLAVIIIGIS